MPLSLLLNSISFSTQPRPSRCSLLLYILIPLEPHPHIRILQPYLLLQWMTIRFVSIPNGTPSKFPTPTPHSCGFGFPSTRKTMQRTTNRSKESTTKQDPKDMDSEKFIGPPHMERFENLAQHVAPRGHVSSQLHPD